MEDAGFPPNSDVRIRWRSSFRKRLARITRKKRPLSTPSSVSSLPSSLTQSSLSLLRHFPKLNSSSSAPSSESAVSSFSCKNNSRSKSSKISGNLSLLKDRSKSTVGGHTAEPKKNQMNPLRKLSGSICSLSSKFWESVFVPHEELPVKRPTSLRPLFNRLASLSNNHLKNSSSRNSVACSYEFYQESVKLKSRDIWMESYPIPICSLGNTFPLNDVIQSFRHIDSSSEEDLDVVAEQFSSSPRSYRSRRNSVCTPSLTSSLGVRQIRELCSDDWYVKPETRRGTEGAATDEVLETSLTSAFKDLRKRSEDSDKIFLSSSLNMLETEVVDFSLPRDSGNCGYEDNHELLIKTRKSPILGSSKSLSLSCFEEIKHLDRQIKSDGIRTECRSGGTLRYSEEDIKVEVAEGKISASDCLPAVPDEGNSGLEGLLPVFGSQDQDKGSSTIAGSVGCNSSNDECLGTKVEGLDECLGTKVEGLGTKCTQTCYKEAIICNEISSLTPEAAGKVGSREVVIIRGHPAMPKSVSYGDFRSVWEALGRFSSMPLLCPLDGTGHLKGHPFTEYEHHYGVREKLTNTKVSPKTECRLTKNRVEGETNKNKENEVHCQKTPFKNRHRRRKETRRLKRRKSLKKDFLSLSVPVERFRMVSGEGRGFRMVSEGRGFRMASGEGRGFKMVSGDGRGFKMASGEGRGFRMASGEGSEFARHVGPRTKMDRNCSIDFNEEFPTRYFQPIEAFEGTTTLTRRIETFPITGKTDGDSRTMKEKFPVDKRPNDSVASPSNNDNDTANRFHDYVIPESDKAVPRYCSVAHETTANSENDVPVKANGDGFPRHSEGKANDVPRVNGVAGHDRVSYEGCYHCEEQDFEPVRWVLTHGEDLLDFHQTPQSTLMGITRQVDNFRHFYSTAKREADKGRSLLQQREDPSLGRSDGGFWHQGLTEGIQQHLCSFADRLHLTKDRLEDTAKCYLLLDKAYEWALEAMKIVGSVKSTGLVSLEEVTSALDAIGELLQLHRPVDEDTFVAMRNTATKLNNETLLQQCKMAQTRCEETVSLLYSRQGALLKAREQMQLERQNFVDLDEVLENIEETSSVNLFNPLPLNSSCRRRSGCSSIGSRNNEYLSRCNSVETDDDSVFSELPFSSTPSKPPLEAKSSLSGIKELTETDEDLKDIFNFGGIPESFIRSSESDFQMPIQDHSSLAMALPCAAKAFSSSSSSCSSSSDSSGPITSGASKEYHSISWRFSDASQRSTEDSSDILDESIVSPMSRRSSLPSAANSHLLIRGSQINLSNSEDLSNEEVRKSKTLLLIMQELIQTERDYVNSLEYIIENYIPEVSCEDIPQALRGQRNVIFANIEKIHEFHFGYFLRELESFQSRPFAVGSVFLKYESQFYLYALYNKNKPKSDDLMTEFGSMYFRAKQMELGDKMDLSSYLLKPVQRMGKYALLLKQLLKECDHSDEGYEDLKAAEEMVQFQLRHGNDLLAMDSLRECDVNLKEQGRLLRQGEFLVSGKNRGRKSLRHIFLFEDLILFSKAKRDPDRKNLEVFQYKRSLKTTDIGLTAQVGDNPLKFEIWFRKRKPSDTFVMHSPSTEMKESWTEEISKLLWRQALKNRKLRLHEMSSMGIGNKPCLDIRPSEDQINDRSVCMAKAHPRLHSCPPVGISDNSAAVRRPQSVISVSSSASSAGSSHSSSAGVSFLGTLNLGFEAGDSPKPLQRSVTRTSQCSAESGIMADMFTEREVEDSHSKVERSNSTATTASADSALSPSTSATFSLFQSPVEFSPSSSSSSLTPPEEPTTVLPPLFRDTVSSSAPSEESSLSLASSTKPVLTTEV